MDSIKVNVKLWDKASKKATFWKRMSEMFERLLLIYPALSNTPSAAFIEVQAHTNKPTHMHNIHRYCIYCSLAFSSHKKNLWTHLQIFAEFLPCPLYSLMWSSKLKAWPYGTAENKNTSDKRINIQNPNENKYERKSQRVSGLFMQDFLTFCCTALLCNSGWKLSPTKNCEKHNLNIFS